MTKLESKHFSNTMRITPEAWSTHSQSTNQSDDWLRSNWKLHESKLQGTLRITQNQEGTARAYLRTEWWEFGISLIRRIRTCPYGCIGSQRTDQFWCDTFGTVQCGVGNPLAQESQPRDQLEIWTDTFHKLQMPQNNRVRKGVCVTALPLAV